MRNGMVVDTTEITPQTTTKEIVDKMLGRSFEENFPKETAEIGEDIFSVEHLSGADGKVNDISFHVRRGEIVGIAGLVGAGKSELCKTIFGAYEKTGGTVIMGGKELKIKNPSQALKNRIALVPEERRKEGVLVNETVSFNITAASLDDYCRASFLNKRKIDRAGEEYVEKLGIKTPSVRQLVRNLSGGNQQKVAVAKWMAADCDLYIFDEPTKGVDVGAKQDIFHLICDIAKRGNGVIYASCENAELLSITDRMYVLFDGQIMAELETAKTSEDEIMHYAVGNRAQYA
jgi:simple sugar transport system ATP-binding protein